MSGSGGVGLLGGTFDPVHVGHVAVARQCRNALGLDEVRLVPSHQPPHRPAPAAPPAERLIMTRLAIEAEPGLSVDDIEVARGGISYSVDTLRALRPVVLGDLWLLLGQDAAAEFSTWHEVADVARLARVAVFNRAGGPPGPAGPGQAGLPGGARIVEVDSPDVSATEVRRRLATGEDVTGMLPASVLRFIRERGLYGVPK